MSQLLTDKIAIITGGASGQGAEEVKLFLSEGATVFFTDVNEEAGKAFYADLKATVLKATDPKTADLQPADLSDKLFFIQQDVSSEQDWDRLVEQVTQKVDHVDILINNAGILSMKGLMDTDVATFDKVMAINTRSVFLGMNKVVPLMPKDGTASIVNISSLAGVTGQYGAIAYSASKWAVRGMTKSAALDLGKDGIRVNCVHPGTIATPMLAAQGVTEDSPLIFCPLDRPGKAKEIAEVVAFLASEKASYINGTEIVADGGSAAGDTAQLYGLLRSLAQARKENASS